MDTKTLLSELFEAAYIVDENRKILFWNKKCEEITGYKAKEIIGKHCYDNTLRHVTATGKRLCHDGCPLFDSIRTGNINVADVFLHHKEGYRVPVRIKTIPFLDETDGLYKAIEIFTDMQDEQKLYKENKVLKKETLIDSLTEVYNRKFLDYQITTCIKEFDIFGTSLGILFIDIDHFKNINDNYGHNIGDEVLKTVSKNIKLNVRKNDFVGRYGGEEFVVILRDISENDLKKIAEKVRILIQDSTFKINNYSINVTVSIGTAVEKEGMNINELLKVADTNMYKAKLNGRNKVV